MLSKYFLQNIVFLDIETVPNYSDFSLLPEEEKELYAEKTKYQRGEQYSTEEYYHRAGILAEFGKIVCISVGYFVLKNGIRQFRTTSFIGEEKDLLQKFSNLVNTYFNTPQYIFCGHNIKEFDIPYISRRMIVNNIKIPTKINCFGKKPWEIPHLETLDMWKFGDYKHYTSLKLLTYTLGIPSPKDDIDGSMVSEIYYIENNIDKIVTYCEKDVLAVAQIFLRLKGEDLLCEDEVISV